MTSVWLPSTLKKKGNLRASSFRMLPFYSSEALFRQQRQWTQNTCTYWSRHALTCHHNTNIIAAQTQQQLVFLRVTVWICRSAFELRAALEAIPKEFFFCCCKKRVAEKNGWGVRLYGGRTLCNLLNPNCNVKPMEHWLIIPNWAGPNSPLNMSTMRNLLLMLVSCSDSGWGAFYHGKREIINYLYCRPWSFPEF